MRKLLVKMKVLLFVSSVVIVRSADSDTQSCSICRTDTTNNDCEEILEDFMKTCDGQCGNTLAGNTPAFSESPACKDLDTRWQESECCQYEPPPPGTTPPTSDIDIYTPPPRTSKEEWAEMLESGLQEEQNLQSPTQSTSRSDAAPMKRMKTKMSIIFGMRRRQEASPHGRTQMRRSVGIRDPIISAVTGADVITVASQGSATGGASLSQKRELWGKIKSAAKRFGANEAGLALQDEFGGALYDYSANGVGVGKKLIDCAEVADNGCCPKINPDTNITNMNSPYTDMCPGCRPQCTKEDFDKAVVDGIQLSLGLAAAGITLLPFPTGMFAGLALGTASGLTGLWFDSHYQNSDGPVYPTETQITDAVEEMMMKQTMEKNFMKIQTALRGLNNQINLANRRIFELTNLPKDDPVLHDDVELLIFNPTDGVLDVAQESEQLVTLTGQVLDLFGDFQKHAAFRTKASKWYTDGNLFSVISPGTSDNKLGVDNWVTADRLQRAQMLANVDHHKERIIVLLRELIIAHENFMSTYSGLSGLATYAEHVWVPILGDTSLPGKCARWCPTTAKEFPKCTGCPLGEMVNEGVGILAVMVKRGLVDYKITDNYRHLLKLEHDLVNYCGTGMVGHTYIDIMVGNNPTYYVQDNYLTKEESTALDGGTDAFTERFCLKKRDSPGTYYSDSRTSYDIGGGRQQRSTLSLPGTYDDCKSGAATAFTAVQKTAATRCAATRTILDFGLDSHSRSAMRSACWPEAQGIGKYDYNPCKLQSSPGVEASTGYPIKGRFPWSHTYPGEPTQWNNSALDACLYALDHQCERLDGARVDLGDSNIFSNITTDGVCAASNPFDQLNNCFGAYARDAGSVVCPGEVHKYGHKCPLNPGQSSSDGSYVSWNLPVPDSPVVYHMDDFVFDPLTPGVTMPSVINGSLIIKDLDVTVTNVTQLLTVVAVTGSVIIQNNTGLTNINGLRNLISIGGALIIWENDNLKEIGYGLSNIESIDGDHLELCNAPDKKGGMICGIGGANSTRPIKTELYTDPANVQFCKSDPACGIDKPWNQDFIGKHIMEFWIKTCKEPVAGGGVPALNKTHVCPTSKIILNGNFNPNSPSKLRLNDDLLLEAYTACPGGLRYCDTGDNHGVESGYYCGDVLGFTGSGVTLNEWKSTGIGGMQTIPNAKFDITGISPTVCTDGAAQPANFLKFGGDGEFVSTQPSGNKVKVTTVSSTYSKNLLASKVATCYCPSGVQFIVGYNATDMPACLNYEYVRKDVLLPVQKGDQFGLSVDCTGGI